MSVTVYVDGWHEQPFTIEKVYLCDRYSFLSEDELDHQGYQKDSNGRHFEEERIYTEPFPEMNLSNGNWRALAIELGIDTEENVGAVAVEDIPKLIHRCLILVNSERRLENASRPTVCKGNMVHFGMTGQYILNKARELQTILKFAQSRNKGIYWG